VHALSEHLLATAGRAEASAARFGSASWGRLAGLWHDLGKFSADFQQMIHAANGVDAHVEHVEGDGTWRRVNRSSAGALHAIDRLGPSGRILAYLVAGHHAGLADWGSEHAGRGDLQQRLERRWALAGKDPAFWIRMLISCLVVEDFIRMRPAGADSLRRLGDDLLVARPIALAVGQASGGFGAREDSL
jgi:CRISPR-associated endonuclease Cas3-HD